MHTYSLSRMLHAPSSVFASQPLRLASFTHLLTLSIDFARDGVGTQHSLIKLFCKYLLPSTPRSASPHSQVWEHTDSSHLTSLTLTSLPRIDTSLLLLLVRTFPRLTSLSISCTERLDLSCCWGCFEDSAGCTVHSPIPDMFADIAGLAVRPNYLFYGRKLAAASGY